MRNTKIKFLLSAAILSGIILVSGCGFKATPPKSYPIKLEVWGPIDDSDAFTSIFDAYRKANPNVVDITYKKLSLDTYQNDLVSALASGQGPDIFLIENTWLPTFQDKIVPVTPDILTEQKFRNDFVDVAASDFIDQGKIYAVPLSVDSLGLYYNKDLFNQAGITAPPADWNEFVDDVKKLTKLDATGHIIQSGAALGTTANINRPTDILNLLMLQNNTPMVDEQNTRALFDQSVQKGNSHSFPGQDALNFYTQFAKANSSFYSWNPDMHYSIDAFSEGTAAMMFNYSWQIPVIRNKAPKLNFAIAPVPQLAGSPTVNFPNYWGFAVAKNKKSVTLPNQPAVPDDVRIAETWKFLTFLTTKPDAAAATGKASFDAAADYAQKTSKPAARKDLIETQKTDVDLGVFAAGNLVDKSWREANPAAIESIFTNMIDSVDKGAATSEEALKTAAAQVTQIMNNR